MKKCSNCGNIQANGAFCGSCGGKLQDESAVNVNDNQHVPEEAPVVNDEPVYEPTTTPTEPPVMNGQPPYGQAGQNHQERKAHSQTASTSQTGYASSPTADAIKQKSQAYWGFFGRIFGNPTRAIHLNEGEFSNGLISALVYMVTFALGLYSLLNSIYRSINYMGAAAPFDIFVRSLFFVAIVGGISFGSMVIMTMVNRSPIKAQALFTKFGALSVPFIVLNLVSVVTALSGGYVLTILLLLFSILLFLYFIPALIVFAQKPGNAHRDQRVYASIGTVAVILIADYIIFAYMLSEMLADFEYLFSSF